MRVRINVVLGAFLMLAMAFGVTAGLPSGVSAQENATGTCQYAVSGNGEPELSVTDAGLSVTGAGLTEEKCRAILEDEFGAPLGTAPGVACQVVLEDGERVLVQGNCSPDAAPEPIVRTPPAPTVPTAKADCMDGGFASYQLDGGQRFKNQGQCIKFVNTGK